MGRPKGSRNKVQKTHCKRGHTLTPENRDKRGKCLACGHARSLNWYYKNLSASKGYHSLLFYKKTLVPFAELLSRIRQALIMNTPSHLSHEDSYADFVI